MENEAPNLILRELNEGDEQAFFAGLEDWKNEELTWFTFVWKPGMSFKEHLTILEKQKDKESLEVGRVPSTMLYAFVGAKIVGRLSVRHELNKGLLERGGHLGYAVSPKHRRSGYASAIYKQGLQFCQKLGLEKILITCSDENIPSWKVIEKLPAHLENRFYDQSKNEFVRRYWITLNESLNSKIQITDKVVAYITRTHLGCAELLVFDHDQKYSDAGTQVPSGTVEANEDIKVSLLREIKEETGLTSEFEIQKIDEYVFYTDGSKKYVRRHVYQLSTKAQLPDKWTHVVSGHGEDHHLNFHFFWLKIEDAKGQLAVRFDDSIFKIKNFNIRTNMKEDMTQLRPMTPEEYTLWEQISRENYCEENIKNGLTPEEANKKTEDDFQRLLPQGLGTPEQYLFHVFHLNENVGYLWFGLRGPKEQRKAFIYDISINENARGKGLGKETMLLLEEEVKKLGLSAIGLHVFGHNFVARNLYDKLGYEITNLYLEKNIKD